MKRVVLSYLIFFLFLNCKSRKVIIGDNNGLELSNYTLELNPNTLDKVGTIFTIDRKTGTQLYIGSIEVNSSFAEIGSVGTYSQRKISLESIRSLFTLTYADSIIKEHNIINKTSFNTKLLLDNGEIRRSDNQSLAEVLSSKSAEIKNNLNFLGIKSKIFIITETVSFRRLTLILDKNNSSNSYNSATNTGSGQNPEMSNENGIIFSKDFSQPLICFIKLAEIKTDKIYTADKSETVVKFRISPAEVRIDELKVSQKLRFPTNHP